MSEGGFGACDDCTFQPARMSVPPPPWLLMLLVSCLATRRALVSKVMSTLLAHVLLPSSVLTACDT